VSVCLPPLSLWLTIRLCLYETCVVVLLDVCLDSELSATCLDARRPPHRHGRSQPPGMGRRRAHRTGRRPGARRRDRLLARMCAWSPLSLLTRLSLVSSAAADRRSSLVARRSTADRMLMGYFRSALARAEKSERAFELTTRLCAANPANYSAWHFRRQLLAALGKDLVAELRLCADMIDDNPKNYQLWYHRRAVMAVLRNPDGEDEFIQHVFAEDAKNYHAWGYWYADGTEAVHSALITCDRQWLVSEFRLWDSQLALVDKLLVEDVRNNSAWNYRHFVISQTSGFTSAAVSQEIACVLSTSRP
jgi:hypothetical protein